MPTPAPAAAVETPRAWLAHPDDDAVVLACGSTGCLDLPGERMAEAGCKSARSNDPARRLNFKGLPCVSAPEPHAYSHLVPPVGAKGMNLALFDVDILAQALVSAVHDHDKAALDNYSDTVLPHIWKYQEFSAWMADTMHDAGDPAPRGKFRQMIARARLDTLFESPTAARLHSEYQRGMI